MTAKRRAKTRDDGLEWLRDIRRQMAAESNNDPRQLGDKLRQMEKKYSKRLRKTKRVLVPVKPS